ncbi:hypothetical protein HBH98_223030 [Parastagonospora nodorum]|nr:hypothetical protein HBH98_223030 [Parastagonospora nodorum]KAH4359199.1 hypothetical protein HBH97_212330 [Parastagonospora nodorum]KAH4373610.1 hypothetical protein HBH99_225280 [Parastagonospora nodorum]KAH4893607.1 hypothetical protein HBH74_197690 [Parastagonospora nodorum]KAH4921804.1 hypothetical protein HBH73_220850 [Parastagonospora nodorum]
MHLPANLAITARSRKFYDGTYTMSSDGFTDEAGVYRAFDCLDAAARAPTPLPPMFSDDEEAGGEQVLTPSSMLRGAARGDTPIEVTFASEMAVKDTQGGYVDGEESLLDEMDGVERRKRSVKIMSKRGKVTPKKSSKAKSGDSSSPLSDCPSDLSEWESKKVRYECIEAIQNRPSEEENNDSSSNRTRGVAQKVVRKTPRKAAPAPALVTRQQDTRQPAEQDTPRQDGSSGWRRSTRRTRNSNGW